MMVRRGESGQIPYKDHDTGPLPAEVQIEVIYQKYLYEEQKRLAREFVTQNLGEQATPEEIQKAIDDMTTDEKEEIRKNTEKFFGDILRKKSSLVYENDLLKQQADVNPLTGLNNRAAAAKIFEQLREMEPENSGYGSLVVVRMDLDGFKGINDQLGHAAGDQTLIQVANKLKEALSKLRPTDLAIHFSGDEFGLILTDVKPGKNKDGKKKTLEETIEQILTRVIADIEAIQLPNNIPLTASAGFKIVKPDENGDFQSFDAQADQAAGYSKNIKFVPGFKSGQKRIANFGEPKKTFLEKRKVSKDQLEESQLLTQFERIVTDHFPDGVPSAVGEVISGAVKVILSAKKLTRRPTNQ
jgi:diguanylate cyclase (GGDEF)-like protein